MRIPVKKPGYGLKLSGHPGQNRAAGSFRVAGPRLFPGDGLLPGRVQDTAGPALPYTPVPTHFV